MLKFPFPHVAPW